MAGMSEVGRLFNNNELIVAEVLQSAEAMKAGVSHLEQFMEKAETATRGKIILATVKGDVHDIGKNLVEIILSNNGYAVINLGIKVPPEDLIRAYEEHQPDAIGLSGLLVKSAQQMVITGGDLKDDGVNVPLLVGGAALSEKFTQYENRTELRRAHFLREGRHDRPAAAERDHGSGDARSRSWRRTFSPKAAKTAGQPSTSPGSKHAIAKLEGASRHPDSRRALPRPPRSRSAQSRRSLELHQSLHALRPASRLQRQFRKAVGRARSQGAEAVSGRRGGEARKPRGS